MRVGSLTLHTEQALLRTIPSALVSTSFWDSYWQRVWCLFAPRQGFKKGMPFEQAKKEALSSEEKTLAGHFRKVDADHDGSLSFAELQARFGQ
eukprot:3642991-Amphidinium_carterae.1